ncbi:molecular chaperone HtpG [Gammaproteobacteria bacterium]
MVKGALDLGELADQDEKTQKDKAEQEHKGLLERIKTALGDRVKAVQVSVRLTDSPACLVVDAHDMSPNLARVLKSVGQEGPKTAPTLEINITHPLLVRMEGEGNETRFADLSAILLDQATLAEGGTLDDPASFVQRLNQLMLSLM